jgi:hypothetical protein
MAPQDQAAAGPACPEPEAPADYEPHKAVRRRARAPRVLAQTQRHKSPGKKKSVFI